MDFFGILFDIKNGKKVPYSKTYFDTLFAAKLKELGVKTLTGTLPLAFRTSETALRSWTIYGNDFQHEESKGTRLPLSFYTDEDKLRDWTIYGNNTQHNYSAEGTLPLVFTTHTAGAASDWVIEGNDNGVGERTKNMLEITAETQTINGVTFTVDKYAGTVTLNGEATAQSVFTVCDKLMIFDGSEIISGSPNDVSGSTYFANVKYQNVGAHGGDNNNLGAKEVALSGLSNFNNPVTHIKIYVRNGIICNNVVFRLMIRPADTSADFVPYGYEIPLNVNTTTQDIYIGSTPLTAGQSISKTSTGVDIAAIAGSNTITTELYNKPSMSIEGVDYVGVGEPTNDGWQIPLTVSDGTNTTTVNVPIDAPLTASDTATKASTGVDIPTYVGTNTISTALENKPEMLVYYGYKGVGEHVGNTWEFNFITSANGNQQLTRITMDKPLRAGETLTSEQAGVTIPTYADAENTLSLYPSAAGYGNPEMTITYK